MVTFSSLKLKIGDHFSPVVPWFSGPSCYNPEKRILFLVAFWSSSVYMSKRRTHSCVFEFCAVELMLKGDLTQMDMQTQQDCKFF